MRVDWRIGSWGPACGPPPSGGGAPTGTVVIRTAGAELVMSGAGRAFSTTECWEQYPGLTRTSHTASPGRWSTVCQTPAGDSRQARLVTTITAPSSARIDFDETGQYQLVIRGQNCTASVRRTRTLTRLEPTGESLEQGAPPLASASRLPPQQRCAVTGIPERLEVRPSRKLMRPGDRFTFRASVVDRVGCPLDILPNWRVATGNQMLVLLSPGTVEVPAAAPEGQASVRVSLADRATSVTVDVVSRERYDALLGRGPFDAEGKSTETAVARIAGAMIGAPSSVAREEARERKTLFIFLIGGLACTSAILGGFFIWRSRKHRRKALALTQRSGGPTRPSAQSEATLCPTCREEYPSETGFCPKDGNRLVPWTAESAMGPAGGVCPLCGQGFDPGVTLCPKHQEPLLPPRLQGERHRAQSRTPRICPLCGTQFPADSQFCGKCGVALVPVN